MSLPTKAADRKATPITTGVLDYFPDAIAEVARVSKAGNDQHNPGQPLHWDRTKSTDHADCIARHLLERGTIDTDGQRHSAKVAWRALALLQTELDEAAREFSPLPPEFDIRKVLEKSIAEARASEAPVDAVFRALGEADAVEEEYSLWPDSPGIWAWANEDEPDNLKPFRYRTTDRVIEGSSYFVIGTIEPVNPITLVPPGSVATGKEVVFGGELGEVSWKKVGDLEPAVAEEPAAVDDGVRYEADQNGDDGIVDWPNRPGVWGYFFNAGDREAGRTTSERYAVSDNATHGGEYLLRRIPSGEFIRRRGSQSSLAVDEFGECCAGWKFIEELT